MSGVASGLARPLRTAPTSEEKVAFSGSIIFSEVVDMSAFSLCSEPLPYPVVTF